MCIGTYIKVLTLLQVDAVYTEVAVRHEDSIFCSCRYVGMGQFF